MSLQKHVKSDRVKWVFTTIALVLIMVLIAGLCYFVITGTQPQYLIKDDTSGTVDETPTTDGGENNVTDEVVPTVEASAYGYTFSYEV